MTIQFENFVGKYGPWYHVSCVPGSARCSSAVCLFPSFIDFAYLRVRKGNIITSIIIIFEILYLVYGCNLVQVYAAPAPRFFVVIRHYGHGP